MNEFCNPTLHIFFSSIQVDEIAVYGLIETAQHISSMINQTVDFQEDTQRCHIAPVPKTQLTLPPLNWLTWPTTRSWSSNRWEVAADIKTGEQYSSTGSMNAQKHLATTATSRKTLIIFLKISTLLVAEAAINCSDLILEGFFFWDLLKEVKSQFTD